jgi:hypothetical protein
MEGRNLGRSGVNGSEGGGGEMVLEEERKRDSEEDEEQKQVSIRQRAHRQKTVALTANFLFFF